METEANIKRFEELAAKISRPGIEKLMEYVRNSDFYRAPASTKFHLSCEGGLLQHSLNVYDCLIRKLSNQTWKQALNKISEESLIIAALFHDLCKTNFYAVELRWRKDANNQWEQYAVYTVKDLVPYGHGEKSVMMIEQFMRLTGAERYAIRWHMGHTEPKENYMQVNGAIALQPLVLALYEADQEASALLEDKDGNKIKTAQQYAEEAREEYAERQEETECGFTEAEAMTEGSEE